MFFISSVKLTVLGWLSLVGILIALYLTFIFAPVEQIMGVVQKIFYFHVPSAFSAFLAFFVTFVASILYLWKRDIKYDLLAHSSAEVGAIFATIVMVTGPIWAKPVWGVWWTWEPLLTTALIMWMLYMGYLMLRASPLEEGRKARFSAVLGIVAFTDVPIVYLSARLWRGIHPVIRRSSDIEPSMLLTLIISLVAFLILYAYLLLQRLDLARLKKGIDDLKMELGIRD